MVGARADRADHFFWLGGGEDEFHVLGRLFDHFQERVEALAGDHVGLVDNKNLVAIAHRREAGLFAQFTGVVHAAVGGGVQFHHVQRARAVACELTARIALPTRGIRRVLDAVQAAREDTRRRSFSAPARP